MATTVPSGTLITPGGDQGPSGATNVLATTTAAGLLTQVSGKTTDFIDGTNSVQNLDSGIATVISQRTRGYNAIGNPNFEVDQRNVNIGVANIANGIFSCDRWVVLKSGTMQANATTQSTAAIKNKIPGTNYIISRSQLFIQVTTQEISLGASDYFMVRQYVEGSCFREIYGDVHSISLMVFLGSTITVPFTFGIAIRDSPATQSLVIPVTVNTTGVYQLITLPNLPVFPSSGNFSLQPGSPGYTIDIVLAAGSSLIGSSANTWLSGNFAAPPGLSNLFAQPVSANLYFAFVQHEPGNICTAPIDKPFSGANGNLADCQRYFQKTYPYGVAVGTTSAAGAVAIWNPAAITNTTPILSGSFKTVMAKAPTVTVYNWNTGSSNSAYISGVSYTVTGVNSVGDSGFSGVTTSVAVAANVGGVTHYVADTGM